MINCEDLERKSALSPAISKLPSPSDAVFVSSASLWASSYANFLSFSGSNLWVDVLVTVHENTDGQTPGFSLLVLLSMFIKKKSSRKCAEQTFVYFVTLKSFSLFICILVIHIFDEKNKQTN